MTGLDDLRREYEQELIGPTIHAEIRTLAGQVASTYSASTYAGSPEWTADALDDLVQDLAADWLLGQGQLAYALAAAQTLKDFRAITVHTIRRALAARRLRSVIDNLLPRCKTLLAEEGYEVVRVGNRRIYRKIGADEIREPTDDELRAAELMAHSIPRLPGRGGDRASAVYTASNLRAVLWGIAGSMPGGFSLGDLDRILHRVLTAWVPGILVTGEELPPTPSEALSPEDVVIVRDTARSLLESLSAVHRKVLALYLASVSDAEAAAILGVKARQTVLRRRSEIAAIISHHLENLESRLSNAVLDELAIALATHGRDSSGP